MPLPPFDVLLWLHRDLPHGRASGMRSCALAVIVTRLLITETRISLSEAGLLGASECRFVCVNFFFRIFWDLQTPFLTCSHLIFHNLNIANAKVMHSNLLLLGLPASEMGFLAKKQNDLITYSNMQLRQLKISALSKLFLIFDGAIDFSQRPRLLTLFSQYSIDDYTIHFFGYFPFS